MLAFENIRICANIVTHRSIIIGSLLRSRCIICDGEVMSELPSIPSGYLTAVLANHWIYDSGDTEGPARLLSHLGGHFDLVLQSCRTGHRVPEAAMFSSALQHLGVASRQVAAPSAASTGSYNTQQRLGNACVSFQALWLDADADGVKAAQGEGMKAILVENVKDALSNLAGLAGLQVQTFKDILLHFAASALAKVCVCACRLLMQESTRRPATPTKCPMDTSPLG